MVLLFSNASRNILCNSRQEMGTKRVLGWVLRMKSSAAIGVTFDPNCKFDLV